MMQTELHQVSSSLQNVSLMKGNRKTNAFTGNPAIKLKKNKESLLVSIFKLSQGAEWKPARRWIYGTLVLFPLAVIKKKMRMATKTVVEARTWRFRSWGMFTTVGWIYYRNYLLMQHQIKFLRTKIRQRFKGLLWETVQETQDCQCIQNREHSRPPDEDSKPETYGIKERSRQRKRSSRCCTGLQYCGIRGKEAKHLKTQKGDLLCNAWFIS